MQLKKVIIMNTEFVLKTLRYKDEGILIHIKKTLPIHIYFYTF